MKDSVPFVDLRSQARLQNLIFPLSKTACHASFRRPSGSKLFNGGSGAGKPGGMHSTTFACHGVHVVGSETRKCFLPHTCKQLVHKTDPALRPATISCADNRGTAAWDTCMDLFEYCSAICRVTVATRLCTVAELLLAWLLTLRTRVAAECSTATQYWCQRSQHYTTGCALPLCAVDTKYSLPVIRRSA